MSSELLPCPFCGGDVELSTYNNGEGYVIECKNHEWPRQLAHASNIAGDIDMVSWGIGDDARNALIEAWNTRAERTCTFSKHEKAGDPYPTCSACGYETDWHECEWYSDDMFVYEKNYCPNCGAKVIQDAD